MLCFVALWVGVLGESEDCSGRCTRWRAEVASCLGTRRLNSSSPHVRFNEENHYNHARLAIST
jgi:hypothetical protein